MVMLEVADNLQRMSVTLGEFNIHWHSQNHDGLLAYDSRYVAARQHLWPLGRT